MILSLSSFRILEFRLADNGAAAAAAAAAILLWLRLLLLDDAGEVLATADAQDLVICSAADIGGGCHRHRRWVGG